MSAELRCLSMAGVAASPTGIGAPPSSKELPGFRSCTREDSIRAISEVFDHEAAELDKAQPVTFRVRAIRDSEGPLRDPRPSGHRRGASSRYTKHRSFEAAVLWYLLPNTGGNPVLAQP